MVKASFLFLVIAVIAVLGLMTGFDVTLVPGWHTYVLPPFAILTIILTGWLCILPLGYFILEKRKLRSGSQLTTWHVVLTLFYFLYSYGTFFSFLGEFAALFLPLIFFSIGQVLFVFRLIKIICGKSSP